MIISMNMISCSSPEKKEKRDIEIEETNPQLNIETDELLKVVRSNVEVKLLADGFQFTEGPVYDKNNNRFLFSDIPANIIYAISLDGEKEEFINPSNKSNGLIFNRDGHLLAAEHEGRAIRKYFSKEESEVVIDNFEGKLLNSPNDLVEHSDGSIYFTDPPYGLSGQDNSDDKDLAFNGIYHLKDGQLNLIDSSMSRPNGLAFTPDERFLYVAQSSPQARTITKFEINDHKVIAKNVIYDGTDAPEQGMPDGMKINSKGYLFATGPGGILIFNPKDEFIGRIIVPIAPTNLSFDDKGKRLFVTAREAVYLIELR